MIDGRPQALYTRLIADLETPVSAFLKLGEGRDNAFLFESVQGGEVARALFHHRPEARSHLALPRRQGGDQSQRTRRSRHASRRTRIADEPLQSLRKLIAETRMELPPGLPPMAVGLFGYLGYDMVRLIERLPSPPPDPLNLPDAILVRPTITAIFDNVRDEILIVTPVWPEAGLDARAAYARASERLMDTIADLERPAPAAHAAGRYPDRCRRSNPTRRTPNIWRSSSARRNTSAPAMCFRSCPASAFAAPSRCRRSRSIARCAGSIPRPFSITSPFPDFAIVGSSPEILVRLRDGVVTIRPIAGTRPRGKTPEEDKALAEELMADPKERAEHLMLVDLGRNDVGRVAKTGDVQVTDSFFIERYSHVMHLVSNVEGHIRDGLDAVDALAAGFPAGTLSGAPKIRAMEIIDEFEKEKRGAVYAGAVGYFAADGSMDTCIVLRTAVVKDGTMYVQAGGGVVADSVPEAEYQETVNKAKALMTAADEAVRFASAARKGQ